MPHASGPPQRAYSPAMVEPATSDDFRIVIDLSHAEREAQRIAELLSALRKRHDLGRYEFTRLIQIQPAGATHSHPILTLGTRFAETEDLLLSTYLHEQMHWYLWRLGGPDHDPVAPFFDELVRRYPKAPTRLPEGARNYEQTYIHLVVCRMELEATRALIGWDRALEVAGAPFGYRWIYRTVVEDWDALGALLEANDILPLRTPEDFDREDRQRKRGRRVEETQAAQAEASGAPTRRKAAVSGGPRKSPQAVPGPRSRKARPRARARGGRSAG